MARIRTIKPAFFRHEELYDAEVETSLPLRVAFAGLWTVADREGRFEWRPRELKLDCLPYDKVDFSRVLDALTTRGFIVKYASGDREYGAIPSFKSHQIVNNRELASVLPEPPEVPNTSITSTREPRVVDAKATPLKQGQAEQEQEQEQIISPISVLLPNPSETDVSSSTWEKAKAKIQARVNPHTFREFIQPIEFHGESEMQVTLRVSSAKAAAWITQHYKNLIADALAEVAPGKRWSLIARPLATRTA